MTELTFLYAPVDSSRPAADCSACHSSGSGCGCHKGRIDEQAHHQSREVDSFNDLNPIPTLRP